MTHVVLDIGAGSKTFGRALRKANPHIEILVLCGEPEWPFSLFNRVAKKEKILKLLDQRKDGVHCIEASYEDFGLPDESLDAVTLNCPHPFMMPGKRMKEELMRCLKPGGVFFSSFPLYDCAVAPTSFERITEGSWQGADIPLRLEKGTLPGITLRTFPQSLVLVDNIRAHQNLATCPRDASYVYSKGIRPGWRLWRKPL